MNPHLNAVVQISNTAMEEARAADAAIARGESPGVLHGVPFTVKDWIETNGLVCAADREARRDYVPRRDATVVARMRAAGAILLGKTKPQASADLHPAPQNPYDASRTPGGSSSGEAVIVAACGSPLGLGSDSGGSIRWPAHCCGVAGLKPSSGLVPNTGHVPPISALVGSAHRDRSDRALRRRSRADVAGHRRRGRVRRRRGADAARRSVACRRGCIAGRALRCVRSAPVPTDAAARAVADGGGSARQRRRKGARGNAAAHRRVACDHARLLGAPGIDFVEDMAAVGREQVVGRRRRTLAVRMGSTAPRVPRLHERRRRDRLSGRG